MGQWRSTIKPEFPGTIERALLAAENWLQRLGLVALGPMLRCPGLGNRLTPDHRAANTPGFPERMRRRFRSTSSRRREPIFAVAALLAALLSACDGSSDGNAEQLIERAGQHLASGDRNAAVIELKNAIQRDPSSAPARMMLAQIYLDGGDGTSAEAELVKAQAAGAKGTNLELLLVRSRLVSGAYQAVIDQVPADLLLDDTGSRALYEARGEALMALQRLDEAVAVFERVLAKENMARAHGGLARIAISRGEFDEAEPHLKEALALEPDRS